MRATQALLAPVLVRIGGPVGVAYGVTPNLSVQAGAEADLPVRVMNSGLERWDQPLDLPSSLIAEDAGPAGTTTVPANLVATWVSVSGQAVPPPSAAQIAPEAAMPGGEATALLRLTAPAEPGQYLLLLDVVSPSLGSLLAHGGVPTLVRVTVAEASAPAMPAAARTDRRRRGQLTPRDERDHRRAPYQAESGNQPLTDVGVPAE